MIPNRRILVSPLNWGLGHASRMIPVINSLIQLGYYPILAGSGASLGLLRYHFPNLEHVTLEDFEVKYQAKGVSAISMALRVPAMVLHMKRERKRADQLALDLDLSGIISDNRYGLISRQVPSVIITHQLSPPFPFLKKSMTRQVTSLINRFDQCWVPDYENGRGLSGNLSQNPNVPNDQLTFVGPLPHVKQPERVSQKIHDFVAVLSGPEPQRSVFEELLTRQATSSGLVGVIVRGVPGDENWHQVSDSIRSVNYLGSDALSALLCEAKLVICRSGYSSIMDLHELEAKALLVPTPGQAEQEYLGNHHHDLNNALCVVQNELNLDKDVELALSKKGFSRMSASSSENRLKDAIQAAFG